MQKRLIRQLTFLVGPLLLACVPVSSDGDTGDLITGTVIYRERIMVPPEAIVSVRLEDVSLADAASVTIAETRFQARGGPPYAFALGYDPEKIVERRRYSLRASIHIGDQLLFSSTEHIPPFEGTTDVEILVRRAGPRAGAPRAGAPRADAPRNNMDSDRRIFVARKIITMDPKLPLARAVAVEDGRVSWVGSLEELEKRFPGNPSQTDERFADHVLMPGFIEPHLHPYIAGILLSMEFITPHDWQLADRRVSGVRGKTAYLERLREYLDGLPPGDWAWTWGYHPLFHGEIGRAELDALTGERPLIVWHRSFHEIYLNSAAIAALAVDEEAAAAHPQVDLAGGRFFENGLVFLLPSLAPRLFEPRRYHAALREARDIIQAGGITTIGDGAFGTIDLETEWSLLETSSWNRADTPFRSYLLMDGKSLGEKLGHEKALALIEEMPQRDGPRLRFSRRQVKLFADGAAYSQLMQLSQPYLDGHHGEWLMEPDALLAAARYYWRAGFQIHLHVNGDAGLDATLHILDTLQREIPRQDHRFTIHHLAYARPDQAQRLAGLGGMVQANPYYLWALADSYAKHGLGPERAAGMVPLNSFAATGMPIAFHSDFTMAPARPLLLAWVAVNRLTADGVSMAPDERLPREQALRAITIDAAWQMGLEDEVGSITVGKRADFVVLGEDPLTVPLQALKDVPVLGTVFEGRVFAPGSQAAEAAAQSR